MRRDIQKAVVIGAGTMGSGIAAQLANAGVQVHLLDIVPQDASDRDAIAKSAIERMLKAQPATDPLNAGLMAPENAKRITPGNIEDHLKEAIKYADWIVEVVLEELSVKQELYAKLDAIKKPGAIVSSNTSTIPLQKLVEGRSDEFKQNFIITHFFNPPRFMHLLEIVGGPDTDPDVLKLICEFGDFRLGKNVIICKDTPAFLANRIGIYFMFRAINEAIDQQVKIEEADAVLGTPIGYPKDGIFGLLDLVGVNMIPLVTDSMLRVLPETDRFRDFNHEKGLALVNGLVADGRLGRKSPKGGFYRMLKKDGGGRQKQALDLSTGEYYDVAKKVRLKTVKLAKTHGPRAVMEDGDPLSRFAWVVVRDTLLYAAWLVPEIADDFADIDEALQGGYNARWGPFEQIDQLGVEWFCNKVRQDGLELPPILRIADGRSFYKVENGKRMRLVFDFENNRAEYAELSYKPGILKLSDVKLAGKPLVTHHSASLWDIGDGVTCLEFHSKMNTFDPSLLWVVNESIRFINNSRGAYKAMVIYNEEKNFSLGANLGLIQAGFEGAKKVPLLGGFLEQGMYKLVDDLVYQGQSVFKALREAPFPVIGAPNGMALGGGCEILLHCDALQAGAETYMGLVESGVGVIPAWGGCARYLERAQQADGQKDGPVPPVRAAFQTILMPQFSVSTSAFDAKRKLWLRPDDGITMNPDRVLADAKAKALAMAENYVPPEPAQYQLPGPPGKGALSMAIDDFYVKGDATWHDVVVADALADVLTGSDTWVTNRLSDNDIKQLERESFVSLVRTAQSKKRIAHTLKTGKPLREEPAQNGKTLDEIRAMRKPLKLPKRPLSGRPLEGGNLRTLRWMAEVSAALLKRFAG